MIGDCGGLVGDAAWVFVCDGLMASSEHRFLSLRSRSVPEFRFLNNKTQNHGCRRGLTWRMSRQSVRNNRRFCNLNPQCLSACLICYPFVRRPDLKTQTGAHLESIVSPLQPSYQLDSLALIICGLCFNGRVACLL